MHTDKRCKILLLNASYEAVRLIGWQKAICLLYTQKAVAPGGYDHEVAIRTIDDFFYLPTALVLKNYVRIPYYTMRPTRKNVFRRDSYTCQYTGERLALRDATIDHIIPTSRGGKNTWENMVTCSRMVNQRKGDRDLQESGFKLIRPARAPSRAELLINAYPEMKEWQQFLPRKKVTS